MKLIGTFTEAQIEAREDKSVRERVEAEGKIKYFPEIPSSQGQDHYGTLWHD